MSEHYDDFGIYEQTSLKLDDEPEYIIKELPGFADFTLSNLNQLRELGASDWLLNKVVRA